MKKIVFLAIFILGASLVLAGNSNVNHLYLFEKENFDCNDTASCWNIVEDGAWGKLMFKETDDKFVFNGHGLVAEQEYVLLSYEEPEMWPACYEELGVGTANKGGNVHIAGVLPELIVNEYEDMEDGAKIWLVPKSDVNGTCFTDWYPENYLFENNLV